MFTDDGSPRAERKNRLLAGYLAFVAGYANSAGYVLIGTFPSHVTGNVGRLANDVAAAQSGAALSALLLVLSFFFGAFLVSVVVESSLFTHVAYRYAVALGLEALFLATFMVLTSTMLATHPRVLDAQATLLCAAMGMQNGLVTRLSGAVVRTTHLTGVVTDLGIEAARWFRWWRKSISDYAHVPLVLGRDAPERPATRKVMLLSTIAGSFAVGALLGATGALRVGRASLLVAIGLVALCAVYAIHNGRLREDDVRDSRT